jgi:hypothetical protein
MEATMLVLVLIIGLVALGRASLIWGADSREPYRDDHTR